jgi:hypothetical protein
LAEAVETLTSPATWIRIGLGILGAVLLGYGLVMLAGDIPAVKKASGLIADFVPGGKILKGVKRSRRRSRSATAGTTESNRGDNAISDAAESVKDAYNEMRDSGE